MSKDKKKKIDKQKKAKTMDEVSAGYENFMKDKAQNEDGKALFDKVLKKAATAKPSDLK